MRSNTEKLLLAEKRSKPKERLEERATPLRPRGRTQERMEGREGQ